MKVKNKLQDTRPLVAKPAGNQNATAKCLSSGFSIVEVLVAGALLMIAVIGVVAVVQKSGDLQLSGSKRLAARMFLSTQFEERYCAEKYAWLTVPQKTQTMVVFGDTTNGAFGITGDLYTTIGANTVSGVPYKEISLALAWTEIDSSRDSITLTKWLTE